MDGNAPWGGQTPPPQTGPQLPMPNAGSAPPPPWPPQPVAKPPRRGLLVSIGVAVAVLLSAAALVVSLVKGIGDSSTAPNHAPTARPEPTQLFVDDADRDLCKAMGSLMRESSDSRNALTRSGAPNTPERKAAIPQFITDAYDWSHRAQEVLNQHSSPPRFLVRNFQRYIDDSIMYAEALSPDRDASIYENQIYDSGIMDLSGLIGRCADVDVPWWK
jgi:hypothetical protein